MTLQEYIGSEITTVAMAHELGVSQPYAWRLVNDPLVTPSPMLALKIETWSGGKVKAEDICPKVAAIRARPAKRRARVA